MSKAIISMLVSVISGWFSIKKTTLAERVGLARKKKAKNLQIYVATYKFFTIMVSEAALYPPPPSARVPGFEITGMPR